MASDGKTMEELTAIYRKQSPTAFTSIAMSAHLPPTDHSTRVDEETHGGDAPCDYCCCSEKGYCNSWGWHICVAGGVIVCCVCCCYATDGCFGNWPWWPY